MKKIWSGLASMLMAVGIAFTGAVVTASPSHAGEYVRTNSDRSSVSIWYAGKVHSNTKFVARGEHTIVMYGMVDDIHKDGKRVRLQWRARYIDNYGRVSYGNTLNVTDPTGDIRWYNKKVYFDDSVVRYCKWVSIQVRACTAYSCGDFHTGRGRSI